MDNTNNHDEVKKIDTIHTDIDKVDNATPKLDQSIPKPHFATQTPKPHFYTNFATQDTTISAFDPVIINTKSLEIIEPINPLRNFLILSAGGTSYTQGKVVTISSPISTSDDNLSQIIQSFFNQSPQTALHLIELGSTPSATDISNAIQSNNEYGIIIINDEILSLGGDALAVFKELDNLNTPNMVIASTKQSLSTSLPTTASLTAGITNLALILENSTSMSMAGYIAGQMASAKFDFSYTNKISPLIYSSIQGATFTKLSNAEITQCYNLNLCYMADLIRLPSIYNIVCQNGDQFLYAYSYKYTSLMIKQGITQYLMQSAYSGNNLQYNQDGIDKLELNIISSLKSALAYGLINQFGITQNGQWLDKGVINAIPFAEYIKNNPDNYQQGIYGGFSWTIQVSRYFKQIQLDIVIQ